MNFVFQMFLCFGQNAPVLQFALQLSNFSLFDLHIVGRGLAPAANL
jgi:hypothetical protein